MERNVCASAANYALVTDLERVLPFLFELDEEKSVLYPESGQSQRFCYRITALGADTAAYADLSHFVFSACPSLALADFSNIAVSINGVSQTVIPGQNVEWRTVDAPDPPTGCPGLKFDFPLNKVSGVMDVCFTLAREYPIGAMPVCVTGGGVTASSLSVCGPVCIEDTACTAVGYQRATVCVPVTVTPTVSVGRVVAYCCGASTVTPGTNVCPGIVRGSCTFTITQAVCVAVPVNIGADASVGAPSVACGDATADAATCADCAASPAARSTCACQR